MLQASVFQDERNATKSAKFSVWSVFSKAGVPAPCSLTGLWLIWPRLPWVPSVRTQAGKTGRDIKETRVWKRKTRMRCRGNVSVNTGCSYRGPFQVDQPVYLFQTHFPPPLLGRVRHTSMPKTDNARWHRALMAEFIDIFITLGQGLNAGGGRQGKQYFSQRCFITF